jgi:hypothetical protein
VREPQVVVESRHAAKRYRYSVKVTTTACRAGSVPDTCLQATQKPRSGVILMGEVAKWFCRRPGLWSV